MKYKITFLALLLSLATFSQKSRVRTDDQYSFEVEYGLNMGSKPRIVDFGHWSVSFRYMLERNWGLKFDFAKDQFSETSTVPETGANLTRISVQVVNNLGRTLNSMTMSGDKLGLLGHAGIGYTALTSNTIEGTDNIMHIIVGLTPQFKVSKSIALYVDASYIANFSQQINFAGVYPTGKPEGFTGSMFNAALGISYYFGDGKSRADWNDYSNEKDGNRNYD